MDELQTVSGEALSRCVYSDRQLILPDDLKFEEWIEVVERIKQIQEASAWWLGDALVYGEQKFGESYSQIAEATQRSVSGVSLAVTVARAFPPDERSWDLSYTHYAEVAYNEPQTATKLLEEAEKEGWSAQELRRHSRNAKIQKNLPPHSTEEKKKIHVAYADWSAVAFRLKQYAEDHPIIADRIHGFIAEMEGLLQRAMRRGKINEEKEEAGEQVGNPVNAQRDELPGQLQDRQGDLPPVHEGGGDAGDVGGDSRGVSGVRTEPAGGTGETQAGVRGEDQPEVRAASEDL